MLESMLGPGIQAANRPAQLIHGGRPPFLGFNGGHPRGNHQEMEVVMEGPPPFMLGGPRGGQPEGLIIEEVEGPGPKMPIPMEAFSGLFPGPLLMEKDSMDSPFGAPDPLVMDMLQDIGRAFHEEVLPKLAAAPQGRSTAPHSCSGDLKKHCSMARSQLHCLGQHAEDVSEPCRQDVGKSVPFVCSRAIDKFCNVMRTGVLSCLENHLFWLRPACKDAVLATRHVIKKVSTGKASLIDLSNMHGGHSRAAASTSTHSPATPHPATQPPHANSPPAQKEATLDARLLSATGVEGPRVAEHGSPASSHGLAWSEAHAHTPILGILILVCLVVIACISFSSASAPKAACSWLRLPFGVEGREPLRAGLELPRPTELNL